MHQILLLTCLLLSPSASETGPPKTAPVLTSEANTSELRVYIDPQTGQITSQPTTQQRLELERLVRLHQDAQTQDTLTKAPLPTFPLESGGTGVRLDRRFFSSLTAVPGGQSGWSLNCHDNHSHAVEAGAEALAVPLEPAAEILRDAEGRAIQ